MDSSSGPVAAEDESEYEYEYDSSEMETFLVDLDLSSLNERNRTGAGATVNTFKRPTKRKRTPSPEISGHEARNVNPEGNPMGAESTRPREPMVISGSEANGAENEIAPPSNIQILDFNTLNPIVAYRGQIYSCTWSDMVGTNLFVTQPQSKDSEQSIRKSNSYDLIGMSRIKLVGHTAKVAPKAASKGHPKAQDGTSHSELPVDQASTVTIPEGSSLGGLTRTNPSTNIEIKKQADFLEKLMDIKRARGETDNVRTFVTRHTLAAETRRNNRAKNEKQKQTITTTTTVPKEEIERLNRLVVRGDSNALVQLQEIYSQLDNSDEVVEPDNTKEGSNSHAVGTTVPIDINDNGAISNSPAMSTLDPALRFENQLSVQHPSSSINTDG